MSEAIFDLTGTTRVWCIAFVSNREIDFLGMVLVDEGKRPILRYRFRHYETPNQSQIFQTHDKEDRPWYLAHALETIAKELQAVMICDGFSPVVDVYIPDVALLGVAAFTRMQSRPWCHTMLKTGSVLS